MSSNDKILRCRRVHVAYVYRFLFTAADLDGRHDELVRNAEAAFASAPAAEKPGVEYHRGERLASKHRTILPLIFLRCPHLSVLYNRDCSMCSVSLDGSCVNQGGALGKDRQELPVSVTEISAKVALFEMGAGICRYEFTFEPPASEEFFSREQLIELSNLGEASPALEQEDRRQVLLEVKRNGKESEVDLYEWFLEDVKRLLDVTEKTFGKNAVEWIDRSKGLLEPLATPVSKCPGSVSPYHDQDPYVIMILEIPEADYKTYLLDSGGGRLLQLTGDAAAFHRQLTAVALLRSKVSDCPDGSFVRKHVDCETDPATGDWRLTNMSANSRFFVHIHTEVALAVVSDMYGKNDDELPEDWTPEKLESYKGLVDVSMDTLRTTVSFLMMRWHSFTVANAWLDRVISDLSRAYASKTADIKPGILREFLEMQPSVIEVVGAVTRLQQDPITHRTSSGSSFVLYDAGVRKLRLEELSRIVEPKLRALSYYYETMVERIRRLEVDKLDQALKSSGQKK